MISNIDLVLSDILALANKLNDNEKEESIISSFMMLVAKIANADGAFLFLASADGYISLNYSEIKSFASKGVKLNASEFFSTTAISQMKNKVKKCPIEMCAVNKDTVNIVNLYQETDIDVANVSKFDEDYDYSSVSVLALPLLGKKGNLLGVVQLTNAMDISGSTINFSSNVQNAIMSMSNILVMYLESKIASGSYRHLLESFIEVIARAIDAKSPYTGAHCQRVPILTRLLATAAVDYEEGNLKDFEMGDDDWYALHIASWLHDCGKITTPEYVMDKATRLETIYNRLHEIRTRFEVLRRDAHIEYLQKRLANVGDKESLQAEFVQKVKGLEEDFAFIAKCNKGETFIGKAEQERLNEIAKRSYMRYFDKTLGLSWAEDARIKDRDEYAKPAREQVLQNRDDLMVDQYNRGELYNLQIARGTIAFEEREKINEHVVESIKMLEALSFPPELKSIVEFAGAHHERMDGHGYPNGLKGEDMSVPAKIMAIADVFEGLSAKDRPYKIPKKLSEVLKIMQEIKNTGHLDPDLYEVFIKKGVYMDYAKEYIEPEQIDEFNFEEYL